MAASQLFIFMQFLVNLEKSNVSKAGCRWLSKANWKSLTLIDLRNILIIKKQMISIGRVGDI